MLTKILNILTLRIFRTQGISTCIKRIYGEVWFKRNQTIELKEKFGSKKYKFTIKGTYVYPASLCIFMTRENFNKVFDKDKDYFCGYFSNKKLDIDDMYVASIITEKDLTVMSDQ